jgi:hypothetical protein
MTKELIGQHLREQGLKITPQGLAVIDVLLEKGGASPRSGFGLSGGRKEDEEYQPFHGLRHAERTRAAGTQDDKVSAKCLFGAQASEAA